MPSTDIITKDDSFRRAENNINQIEEHLIHLSVVKKEIEDAINKANNEQPKSEKKIAEIKADLALVDEKMAVCYDMIAEQCGDNEYLIERYAYPISRVRITVENESVEKEDFLRLFDEEKVYKYSDEVIMGNDQITMKTVVILILKRREYINTVSEIVTRKSWKLDVQHSYEEEVLRRKYNKVYGGTRWRGSESFVKNDIISQFIHTDLYEAIVKYLKEKEYADRVYNVIKAEYKKDLVGMSELVGTQDLEKKVDDVLENIKKYHYDN